MDSDGAKPDDETLLQATTNGPVIQATAELWAELFESFINDWGHSSLELKDSEDLQVKALACQRMATMAFRMALFFQRGVTEFAPDEGTQIACEVAEEVVNEQINQQLGMLAKAAKKALN
jgi:hypothetical protein